MSSEIRAALDNLRARVARLENDRRRTARGHVNQRQAASYLGRSREWLRQRERRGDGPQRNPDGTYCLDNLDRYVEQNAEVRAGANAAAVSNSHP
jgi:hypothetical protein